MSEKERYHKQLENSPAAKEANRFMKEAKEQVRYFGVDNALGLSGTNDKNLVFYYFAQRMLRIEIYDASALLHDPAVEIRLKRSIFGGLVRWAESRNNIKVNALKILEDGVENFVRETYKSPEGIHKSRLIELAVNDLVARSTVYASSSRSIDLNKKTINEWGIRWSPQLNNHSKAL